MLIVSVFGGLGNQLFQYAFARGVAASLGRRLAFDVTQMPYGAPPHRRLLELPALTEPHGWRNLVVGSTRVATADRQGFGFRAQYTLGHRARRLLQRAVVREELGRDETIDLTAIPDRLAWLVGYWQSPNYFHHIGDELRHELMLKINSRSRVESILQRHGLTGGLVAVHVRRGDYADVGKTRAVHGLVSSDFYSIAVADIAGSEKISLTAVVVSDDPEWAAANIRLPIPAIHPELVGPLVSLDALGLMARCHHHVIANSSLSWWGAWLAEHPMQMVRYPSRWIASRPVDPSFRFPEHWTGLSM